MILSKTPNTFCMRLRATLGRRLQGEDESVEHSFVQKPTTNEPPLNKKQILDLVFEYCSECKRMAAVPQGAFAARKVRENQYRAWLISQMEAKENGNEYKGNQQSYNNKPINQSTELTPLKYNSKLMNSIWGLYNRYSVHNFKKNTDAGADGQAVAWGALAPQASSMAVSDNHQVLMR